MTKLRITSVSVAKATVFHLEIKKWWGWTPLKQLGVPLTFSSPEEAKDYVLQWEGSNEKKVVLEFNFNK